MRKDKYDTKVKEHKERTSSLLQAAKCSNDRYVERTRAPNTNILEPKNAEQIGFNNNTQTKDLSKLSFSQFYLIILGNLKESKTEFKKI